MRHEIFVDGCEQAKTCKKSFTIADASEMHFIIVCDISEMCFLPSAMESCSSSSFAEKFSVKFLK